MNSSICTLFEKHFHHGIAGLTNSLYKNGFRGQVYVGYRGALPEWCSKAILNPELEWEGATTLHVYDDLKVHFLPVNTTFHLTNYKPDFMIRLFNGPAKNTTSLSYFDPDIVIKCKWEFFEKWMTHGVALVHEIIATDMPPTHPIRRMWAEVISKAGFSITKQLYSYINGGYCGVHKDYQEYLLVWKKIMDVGIEHFNLAPDKFMPTDRTDPFFATDQDAMNIAAMCCQSPISELGPEGMDFIHGGWTMSHAVGSPKPWKKKFILAALRGHSPTLPESAYWKCVDGPIQSFAPSVIKRKRLSLKIASMIGRIYQKK